MNLPLVGSDDGDMRSVRSKSRRVNHRSARRGNAKTPTEHAARIINFFSGQFDPVTRVDAESCFAAGEGRDLADDDVLGDGRYGKASDRAND
jgi:hypothetical protein